MRNTIIVSLVVFASTSVVAQELPPASDFYYCAHFYRWLDGQTGPEARLKNHISASLPLFEAGASILSGGGINKADYQSSGDALSKALKKAADEGKLVDLMSSTDNDCWSKQRRYTMAILKKSSDNSAAQQPYFTHTLPTGKVDAGEILQRQEFLKAQPGITVDDQNEFVAYSFSRDIGDAGEVVQHTFTKATHPAHPAVIFMSTKREAKGKPLVETSTGSFAGSKTEFDYFSKVVVMMSKIAKK